MDTLSTISTPQLSQTRVDLECPSFASYEYTHNGGRSMMHRPSFSHPVWTPFFFVGVRYRDACYDRCVDVLSFFGRNNV